jgi:hypothetical protein
VCGKRSNILTLKLGFESIRYFKTALMFVDSWMSSNWEAHVAYTHMLCMHSPTSKLSYNKEKESLTLHLIL